MVISILNGMIFGVTIDPVAYTGPNACLLNVDSLFDICSALYGLTSINSTLVELVTTLPNIMLLELLGWVPEADIIPLSFM